MSLTLALLSFLALVLVLSGHEFSHALLAYLQGDRTAQRYGRLTLNPLAHVDSLGTLILPLFGILSGLPVLGWAKPVPFNPYNLKNQKWGPALVALAGPASNFLMAIVFILMLKLALAVGLAPGNLLVIFLVQLAIISIGLGVFNFIPVPPLDGSRILAAFLTHPRHQHLLMMLETRGFTILFILIIIDSFLPVSVLGSAIGAVTTLFFRLFGLAI